MTVSYAQQHYRWNFRFWVTETSSWICATTFIDSTTVLPVLIQALTHSPFLAGLIISIRYLGQGWPQLIAASMVGGKPRKPFFFRAVIPGRLALLWPGIVLLLGITSPSVVIPAIMLAFLAFWVSEGFSIVPWVDMLGKTIPSTRRGRLFATMYIIGGVLGIGVGLLVRLILHHYRFPVGYGVLFLIAFFVISISTISIAVLREPHSPPEEERYSTIALIKDIPNLLRSFKQFRQLIILQGLFGFALLPAPFYILYASELLRQRLHITSGDDSVGIGIFLAIQTAGMIVGNALLGHIGDVYGNRLLLHVLAIIHTLVPFLAIIAGFTAQVAPVWLVYVAFAPTFFGFGGLQGGTWMGLTNYLLDIAPAHDRPAYIAVANSLNLTAIVLPMVGGLLLHSLGYMGLFLIASIFLFFAYLLTSNLSEPREMHTYIHAAPPEAWG